MKTIKISEATNTQLDWLVAKIEGQAESAVLKGYVTGKGQPAGRYSPSTDWSQGGPIIEREKLELRPGLYNTKLWACYPQNQHGERCRGTTGPTPLIAAMRCRVVSKLGDTVEVPEEL